MNPTKYIIDNDTFNKYLCPQTFVYLKEGIEYAAYTCGLDASGDLPLTKYLSLEEAKDYRVVSAAEFQEMQTQAFTMRKQEIVEISENDFWNYLKCMMPCRWSKRSGVEFFHMSERLNGPLVHWIGNSGDRYMKLVDDDCANLEHIAKRFKDYANALKLIDKGCPVCKGNLCFESIKGLYVKNTYLCDNCESEFKLIEGTLDYEI